MLAGWEPPRTTWSGVPHGGWRGARLGPRRGRGHRVVLRASSSLTAGLSNRSHHDDRYPCRRPRRPARGVPGRGVRGPEPGAEGLRSRVDDVAAARGARARGAGQTPRTRPRAAARGTRARGLESRSGAAPGPACTSTGSGRLGPRGVTSRTGCCPFSADVVRLICPAGRRTHCGCLRRWGRRRFGRPARGPGADRGARTGLAAERNHHDRADHPPAPA